MFCSRTPCVAICDRGDRMLRQSTSLDHLKDFRAARERA